MSKHKECYTAIYKDNNIYFITTVKTKYKHDLSSVKDKEKIVTLYKGNYINELSSLYKAYVFDYRKKLYLLEAGYKSFIPAYIAETEIDVNYSKIFHNSKIDLKRRQMSKGKRRER